MAIGIVIYEDNIFLRNSIADLIKSSAGFELKGAYENCDHVSLDMETLKPEVVLMDIEMAGTNGLQGLRIIKKKYPHIHVIMLTVFEDNDSVFEAIRAGASGYLLKKTPHEKIHDAILDVLNGGAPMTSSIARKVLDLFPKTPSRSEELDKLAPREQEVLNLLVTGHSYKMIAEKCGITLETVRSHIKHIYEKLQVHSATEAGSKVFPDRKY
ncbi:MAG: response regulator transcription factor [Saprospiraceae bacterium]|uniref:Response regulator transcription factor n=1 Tax=Candidatus Opimibacter skivensis TaxID=2982028 RepID=A0A9D7XP39_9BACT|nr:response regulator transcription factor [Candidatus Opimibacter skivensis]